LAPSLVRILVISERITLGVVHPRHGVAVLVDDQPEGAARIVEPGEGLVRVTELVARQGWIGHQPGPNLGAVRTGQVRHPDAHGGRLA